MCVFTKGTDPKKEGPDNEETQVLQSPESIHTPLARKLLPELDAHETPDKVEHHVMANAIPRVMEEPSNKAQPTQHKMDVPSDKAQAPQPKMDVPRDEAQAPQPKMDVPSKEAQAPQPKMDDPRRKMDDAVQEETAAPAGHEGFDVADFQAGQAFLYKC